MPEKVSKKTALDAWWSALTLLVRESHDMAFARRCCPAGHVVGAKPTKTKFRYRAGRRIVTIWATNAKDPQKEAVIELDFRAASAGQRPPASGWRLIPVHDNA